MQTQLYQGDCLEVMKQIPDKSIDMILCDLPYGKTPCKWDKPLDIKKLWDEYKRIVKKNGVICLFGIEPFSSTLRLNAIELYKYDWIWKKPSGTGANHSKNMPLRDYECISVFSKGSIGHIGKIKNRMPYNPQGLRKCDKIQKHGSWGMNGTMERKSQKKSIHVEYENYPKMVLNFPRDTQKIHPTQKPVPLLEYLIKTYTNEGETVLDNCMGSGSTGVACVNTNRDFIGIELDENYFNVAKQRIEEAKAVME